jgi:hypothetical protein
MGYLGPEPALADAYRVTARAIVAERARESFIVAEATRVAHLLNTKPFTQIATNWVYGAGTAPAATEFAAWLQQQDDPDGFIAEAVFTPQSRDSMIGRFANDYAEAMARIAQQRGRDWASEALEQAAWERAGGF